MARSIQDYNGQVHAVDSDYPQGDIKDDTGANDGTIVDRVSNADIHQFFMKLLRDGIITANGLPDNEYNGLQFFQGLLYAIHFNTIRTITGLAGNSIIDPSLKQLVNVDKDADTGQNIYLDATLDDREWPVCKIANNSPFDVDVFDNNSGDVNGTTAAYVIASGGSKTFYYDSANTNWIPW